MYQLFVERSPLSGVYLIVALKELTSALSARGASPLPPSLTAEPLATHPAYAGRFLLNIVDHLAEPRAAERAALGL